MVFKKVNPHITLTSDQWKKLESIVKSHTASRRIYEGVRITLMDADEVSASKITGKMDTNKTNVYLAIDWHDEMYYGNIETEGIIGTKNKAGTNYAYEYATASIVVKRKRFAIAAIPVTERTILEMVVKLLDIIKYHGIGVSALLMDGGFYSIDLINYLNSINMNFVMHAPKLRKECNGEEIDKKFTTSSHARRKRDQASFRLVSIYGYSRKGQVLYIFATNIALSTD